MNIQTLAFKTRALLTLLTAGSLLTVSSAASAVTLKVSVENLAPENGTFLTPFWNGFHDGTFDIYDRDVSLDGFPGTESVVEDGINDGITEQFNVFGAGTVQGTILGTEGVPGPIDPGEIASMMVEVDETDPSSQFFSYASMVIPSNDAFIANGIPTAHQIFDEDGNFIGADFIELGSDVLDGGSEVNDELPENTAFFGQATPNTGVDENGGVTPHPGFIPGGPILSTTDFNGLNFTGADFTAEGYQVARIRVELVEDVESVPEPGTIISLLAVGGAFAFKGLRKKKS